MVLWVVLAHHLLPSWVILTVRSTILIAWRRARLDGPSVQALRQDVRAAGRRRHLQGEEALRLGGGIRAGLPFAESVCERCRMSQHAVERTLGKLLTDESFRERFFTAPRVTAWAAGLRLSDVELAALSGLSRSALRSFSASLDPRICRLCLPSESSPDERQP